RGRAFSSGDIALVAPLIMIHFGNGQSGQRLALQCWRQCPGGCSRQFVREHPVGDIVALALGHDGLRILADWILADRILADRSLANRRRRRRRLLTRQVGGGGSAQHGQGCSRSEYNDLHHDYSPCVWTASPSGSPEDRATEEGRPPLPITT